MLLNLNLFINPPFYHIGYFFLNNTLDAVLCSAETKMNIHIHCSFEISSHEGFGSLRADTYTGKPSKSWQSDETP